ncbi:hypothetical protein DFQ26_000601 [Actinomortierella ambigua]|nr:hypothetical protein DFQ26_000601 [Actinomortierella ambigua]
MNQQQQATHIPYTTTAHKAMAASHTATGFRKPTYSQTHRFRNHFQAGSVSLALSYAVMHPLDTVKTRMQVPGGSGVAWSAVFTRETLRLLGKGFFVSSIGAGLQGGARFSFYELTKSYLLPTNSRFQSSHTNPPHHPWWLPTLSPIPATAISAIIGDLASSVIKVPREVITSRLQTGYYAHVENVNAPYVFKAVLREEGPRGLFRGFLSTTARDCPFMVILFTTYENFKAFHTRNMMPPPQPLSTDPNVLANSPVEVKIPAMTSTLFGGISGFLAGYFTTPMDVVRTRIMTFKKSGNARGIDLSMTGVTQQIYREAVAQTSGRTSGGIVQAIRQGGNIYRAFFVGSTPRSVWWFCVCSIFFSTYEVMKQRLLPLDYEETAKTRPIVSK